MCNRVLHGVLRRPRVGGRMALVDMIQERAVSPEQCQVGCALLQPPNTLSTVKRQTGTKSESYRVIARLYPAVDK